MDAGEEKIEDERIVAGLRRTARSVNRRALLTAIVVTVVALVFPYRS